MRGLFLLRPVFYDGRGVEEIGWRSREIEGGPRGARGGRFVVEGGGWDLGAGSGLWAQCVLGFLGAGIW